VPQLDKHDSRRLSPTFRSRGGAGGPGHDPRAR
jgi:hypothetical protein